MKGSNNAFVFRAAATSFGTSPAGEIRDTQENGTTIIYSGTDSDIAPEFQIVLNGLSSLTGSDFIL